ncbi:hypothetical protein OZX69_02845 [Lactobacillus sp. ESL0731]|uniref:hypothetical protein n=1 Tax=unclassified Lactobacillus TaxID=2620435 RepID=UPI0023F9FDA9|nr:MULTISPECIES: hypothetical protein [unclassified Lactobacillus]WEV51647.1 hypothetical protein OZX63_02845 [Lactobacillus sp. ESL0700]WEV62776.1 hypothetical protein OZX69_02845 [Lactobacillus sp. ESL0731]
MNLKQFNSKELLEELLSRGYLRKIETGPYKHYRLKAKYGAEDDLNPNEVFIIPEAK